MYVDAYSAALMATMFITLVLVLVMPPLFYDIIEWILKKNSGGEDDFAEYEK